ncbi:beta-lactamase regulating signal transducer with metallopeptidase domain [Luteibacter sp. OK325]|uniref:M56 family metallopeptidase n=1 Tax=Luteibacter sp. OK325 TaxID=2135670 RepID=UPI000D33D16D|nr:M56 family metallopeptidase [Luteibacter sp. OK325]PTR28540.1 beta-lactamase regulating signal transducer with metallopeptidase domain [Luteibacter sp. OK325]
MDAFLDTLLSRLAHASVQALLLAAIVHVTCRVVPSLSAAARSSLWWLLGAQLIVGIACPTLLGVPLLPAAPATTVTTVAILGDTGAVSLAADTGWTFSWTYALLGLWLAAVLAQCAVAAVRLHRLLGVARRAIPHDDVRVEALCARRARELGLRRSPRLAVSDEVESPQVIGLWRPTILLPLDDGLGDDELDMALMHELAHVRRGDLVLGWIPAAARTLFFFHPLVHFAVREYALCREAACDALVVSRGRQAPKTYGRLLLRLGVAPHPHHALPGASPTFQNLKRRLDMLGHATDAPPRVLTVSIVIAIAAIGVMPWRVVAADNGGTQRAAYASVPPAAPAAPAAPPAPAEPAVAPSAHAVSMPPPAPPAPMPPPPVPPAPPVPAVESVDIRGGEASHALVFFGDDVTVINGSSSDIRRAKAQRDNSNDYVWFRNGDQAWVLRDPAYVKRITTAFTRSAKPADMGAMSADKVAELDNQQAILDEQMAKLGERQAELAAQESDPTRPRDPGAYAAGHAALGHEQAAIAQKMAQIGQQRAMQGKTQAEWGRRQAEAARQATKEVNDILAEAVRNHAAQAAR